MSDAVLVRVRRGLAVVLATCTLAVVAVPPANADPVPPPAADDPELLLPAPDPQPSPEDVAGEGAVVVEPIGTPTRAPAGMAAQVFRVPAAPVKTLPIRMDAHPGFQRTLSCDPTTRPGVQAFADLLATHYGKSRHHVSRACRAGDDSQHYEGRALDWSLDAYNAGDAAIARAVTSWLAADGGAVAKRFGIMYMIWDRKIWYVHRPGAWEAYNGPSPHTDHIHFSFTWDGAMKRTSWWTGTSVEAPDYGTCRVYAGQYAPRYTGPRTTPCPLNPPAPPASSYRVYLPGAVHNDIKVAQGAFGFAPAAVDGSFGPMTLNTLLAYQRSNRLPVTGVLDNATWAMITAVFPEPPFQQIVSSPDLTGDGHADVVAVDSVGRLHLYPGTGTGGLGRVRSFGRGWNALTVYAPGDWNGDGAADLVAVDQAGLLWLYPGDGRGGFGARQQIGNGWTGYRIVPAGDVNNDGPMDLLAIDPQNRLWLYPGTGLGTFGRRGQVGNGWGGFDLYAAGDMNRDGLSDILSIDASGRLWYYAGRGAGFFHRRTQVGHGWTGYRFASGADFNGDGVNDLLGRDPQGRLWLYSGQVGGTFARKVQIGHGW